MNWRDLLKGHCINATSPPHSTQNPQNTDRIDNCADTANIAYGHSTENLSRLLEALSNACRDLPITAMEIYAALAPEDITDWQQGTLNNEALAAFARSLVQRQLMEQGQVPGHYTEKAHCQQCGPVWLWLATDVLSCPWCFNRLQDKPIPRPQAIFCQNCLHFERTHHPHLGHCGKGEPESLMGLWGSDPRHCDLFLPCPTKAKENLIDTKTNNTETEFPK
jgi:hypothetical protein